MHLTCDCQLKNSIFTGRSQVLFSGNVVNRYMNMEILDLSNSQLNCLSVENGSREAVIGAHSSGTLSWKKHVVSA